MKQAYKYSDICLIPNYSEVPTRVACNTRTWIGERRFKLPIIPANMKSVINMDISRYMSVNDYFYIMHRFDNDIAEEVATANSENWKTISFSVGVQDTDKDKIIKIKKHDHRIDYLTIDIAHGHSLAMKNMIKAIRKALGDSVCIIAGNVCTPLAVKQLYSWGADIVKVGIGQGSPCTTKDKTGFTMPMFTCIQECATKVNGIPIIADGGISCNGDIAKALVAGASMVMAGGMFAKCLDSPAEVTLVDNRLQKVYYGSASAENKNHNRNIEGTTRNLQQSSMTYAEKLQEIQQDIQSSISYGGGEDLSVFNCNNVQYRVIRSS